MGIIIKKMETDEEIRGKAYVHWQSWHEAYPGLVSPGYLEKLTLEKCEKMAFTWPQNTLIAVDEGRVAGIGTHDPDKADSREIMALRHHLRSEQYVVFTIAEGIENLFHRADILRSVAVHADNFRIGHPFRNFFFKLLDSATDKIICPRTAGMARRIDRIKHSAIVAQQRLVLFMVN